MTVHFGPQDSHNAYIDRVSLYMSLLFPPPIMPSCASSHTISKARTRSLPITRQPPSIPQLVIELTIAYIYGLRGSFIDEITRTHASGTPPSRWRRVLARLCLVQKSWTDLAQRVLRKRVVLQTERHMFSALVNLPAFQFATHELWVTHPAALVQGHSHLTTSSSDIPRHILTSQILSRFSALRYLSFQIGNFSSVFESHELLPLLHKITSMTQLEGLTLTHSQPQPQPRSGRPGFITGPEYNLEMSLECKMSLYPYFASLCEIVAKLRRLRYLHIGNFSSKGTELHAGLSDELHSCTPPKGLKTIILENADVPLAHNYVRWLFNSREGYSLENLCIKSHTRMSPSGRVRLISEKILSIRRLDLDVGHHDRLGGIMHDVQTIVLNCPSVKQVHLNFTPPKNWFELPAHVEELSFRFDVVTHNHYRVFKQRDTDLLELLILHHGRHQESKLRRLLIKSKTYRLPNRRRGEMAQKLFPMVSRFCTERNITFKFEKEVGYDEMTTKAELMKMAERTIID